MNVALAVAALDGVSTSVEPGPFFVGVVKPLPTKLFEASCHS